MFGIGGDNNEKEDKTIRPDTRSREGGTQKIARGRIGEIRQADFPLLLGWRQEETRPWRQAQETMVLIDVFCKKIVMCLNFAHHFLIFAKT